MSVFWSLMPFFFFFVSPQRLCNLYLLFISCFPHSIFRLLSLYAEYCTDHFTIHNKSSAKSLSPCIVFSNFSADARAPWHDVILRLLLWLSCPACTHSTWKSQHVGSTFIRLSRAKLQWWCHKRRISFYRRQREQSLPACLESLCKLIYHVDTLPAFALALGRCVFWVCHKCLAFIVPFLFLFLCLVYYFFQPLLILL